jgi:hypothetical protein
MTDEELETLQTELSQQIERLSRIPDKQMSRTERKHQAVLRARKEALDRVKGARGEENTHREAKANLDYAILTEYGERNIFLYNFMKARMSWWMGW